METPSLGVQVHAAVQQIQARSYQKEAVGSLYTYFGKQTGNPVVAMPTGTGKSVVIAMFLESVFRSYPSQRVMVLTHVKELIQQNYEKLMQLWPNAPAGINSAGLGRKDTLNKIIFAGIGTVAKKWMQFGHVDLIIIDEAHLVSPSETTMYQAFLRNLLTVNPALKVIGFTATPWRLGHGKLTDPVREDGKDVPGIFTDVCFDITGIQAFNRLIAEGYLAPVVPKSTLTKLDVDGVHMRGGEYIQSELQGAVDKHEITSAAVREAMELGHDRGHWLVFAAGVDHAIHTAEIMNDMGVPTIAIHSKMSAGERDQGIIDFKAGKYRAAVNNNVLTTGFDFPAIDLILCLRPTQSAVLWVQMLGRGTRPSYDTGKTNCLVLDFANNTRRLGPINDPVVPRRKGEKGGDAPVKECPVCSTFVHASLRWCDGVMNDGSACTNEFTFETKLKQAASTAELIKGDLPITELFKVDHITYSEHTKQDRPPMMKVTYYCGFRMFEEFVCVQHDGFAGRKARAWWRERSDQPMPPTTLQALEFAEKLSTASHLRVWINKKYPEILKVCFDGTAFGTQEAPEVGALPTVQTHSSPAVLRTEATQKLIDNMKAQLANTVEDDDIPF